MKGWSDEEIDGVFAEVREQAVRMVAEQRGEHESQWSAIVSIAGKIGATPQTLLHWVRQHERDTGHRKGHTGGGGQAADPARRLNGALSAASPVTQIYYDPLGRQVALRDADGHVNGQAFDAAGDLLTETHADAGVAQRTYDAFGEQTRLTDAMGYVTANAYDRLGDTLSVTHLGVPVGTLVDGVPSVATEDLIGAAYTYDAAGRKIAQTVDGITTLYRYDARGNIVATTDALGNATLKAYDDFDREIAEQDPDAATATWAYDRYGELVGSTDIGGATTTYAYDAARQLVARSSTRGQVQEQNQTDAYDAAGQLVELDDLALDQQTTYTYNSASQHVLERTVQAGVAYQDQILGYDTLGRLTHVTNTPHGVSVVNTYDRAGNKTHEVATALVGSTPRTQSLWFAYDTMNRQILVDGAVDGNAANRPLDPWPEIEAAPAVPDGREV